MSGSCTGKQCELFTIEGKLYTTLFSEKILKDFVDGIKAQYDYVEP